MLQPALRRGARTLVSDARGAGGVALDCVRVRGRNAGDLVRDWARAGFHVEDGRRVVVGAVVFELSAGAEEDLNLNILNHHHHAESSEACDPRVDLLKFRHLPDRVGHFHGGAFGVARSDAAAHRRHQHPNGVHRVDHVVIRTNELDKVEAFMSLDMNMTLRKRMDSSRGAMLFYREKNFPEAPFIEVVGEKKTTEDDAPSTFVWGVSFVSDDLQRARDVIGHENISEVRKAVQPGRSICTVKIDTLGAQAAIMTPHVARRARM